MYQEDNERQHYLPPPPVVTNHTDNLLNGVVVPGLQALITAILSGIVAGAVAAWLHLPYWGIGFTAAAVAALASWLSYRARWAYVLESLLGVDLNRDGFIGAAPQQPVQALPESVRVELIQDEGRRGDFIDLPYPEKLPQLAAGLTAGRSFNQTAWVGSHGIFSRSEFDEVRDTMIERGLAAWKNPEAKAQGVTLTAAGRAVMKRLSNRPPTLPGGRE